MLWLVHAGAQEGVLRISFFFSACKRNVAASGIFSYKLVQSPWTHISLPAANVCSQVASLPPPAQVSHSRVGVASNRCSLGEEE